MGLKMERFGVCVDVIVEEAILTFQVDFNHSLRVHTHTQYSRVESSSNIRTRIADPKAGQEAAPLALVGWSIGG